MRAQAESPVYAGAAPDSVPATSALARHFARHGTLVRLARHQRLALDREGPHGYFIHSGAAALETLLPARCVLGFCFDGDLLECSQLPAFPELKLLALKPVVLWRVRAVPATQIELVHDVERARANLLARFALATAVVSRLTAEQRVASLLVMAAARGPRIRGNQASADLPMSRADIADHLGLNPDTVSRILTSLQGAGLISMQGRHQARIGDWQALCACTPLAPAIIEAA